jgi:queuosine precursor transporter
MNPTFAFILITLIAFTIPLFLMRYGRQFLTALIPIYLIVANTFAESFIDILGVPTSLAVPIYSAIFLITDMLSEHYGKSEARKGVWVGFVGQIFFVIMMMIIINSNILPEKQEAYQGVFNILPRLVIGSVIAYFISQFFDVFLYHIIKKKTGEKNLFLRNNISTSLSQLVDTSIFMVIAFWGVAPFDDWKKLTAFILSTWMFKIAVALFDYPFILLSKKIYSK